MYASLEDINTHLPTDKLEVTEAIVTPFALDADRIVRGYLTAVFDPTTLAAWADPEHTPELIRSISGRLIAAAYYAERFAEDGTDVAAYAQKLYNDALNMLQRIQNGRLQVVDLDGITVDANRTALSTDDFTPNAKSTAPFFTVDQTFS